MKPRTLALLAVPLMLGACGDTHLERAGSGAVLGAFVGGVTGALCCADPIDGAGVGIALGAAGGGLIGALTPEPLFFNHEGEYWPYEEGEGDPAASAASSAPAQPTVFAPSPTVSQPQAYAAPAAAPQPVPAPRYYPPPSPVYAAPTSYRTGTTTVTTQQSASTPGRSF